MGAFTSRQNAAVDNAAEMQQERVYKYPPRSGGNFFGTHFIMGGERFDTPQPESYLFGENADLNFLGNRPTAFPYPPPQNEPTKTLKSLVNIRKESVRFVRASTEKAASEKLITGGNGGGNGDNGQEQVDGNVLCSIGAGDAHTPSLYNIEFTFDSDAKCAITIYYFCTEEVSPSGVTLTSGLTSETFYYPKGINQHFSQPSHVFNPQLIPEDDLIYNPGKEQYPVAIHCVVEEGNEDCRQSHTTICVIDHHDNSSYVLRALKQKIFVDGLCYLLQEIYGIENKAINKSSIDEEVDDHGSECVICMSETRDTLILPCRHLCLCNSCADSLRYQANNCPICRAPFRALLQIRAVQKGISPHSNLHQNTPSSGAGEPAGCENIPPGYIPVSLIEALNGPPQYVARSARQSEGDVGGDSLTAVITTDNHKATSPLKPNNHRRNKSKKHVATSTTTTPLEANAASATAAVAVNTATANNEQSSGENTIASGKAAVRVEKQEKLPRNSVGSGNSGTAMPPQDNLQIVNERNSFKMHSKSKRHSSGQSTNSSSHNEGDDDDSDNEKLSPLLSPDSKYKPGMAATPSLAQTQVLATATATAATNDIHTDNEYDEEVALNRPPSVTSNTSRKSKRSESKLSATNNPRTTDEDAQISIIGPLCTDRMLQAANNEKVSNLRINSGSLKTVNSLAKKNLQKKSTSVGNILGPTTHVSNTDLKGNVSSLPDMLDSPISGNSASTRSSSDSYSSSSSTKQLLSSNPTTATTTTAANIITDGDKAALQKAVNV